MGTKYDKLVEYNKKINGEKEKRALSEIKDMLQRDEQVTIAELVKRTSLSRSFFYNNEKVRSEISRARDIQGKKDFTRAKKVILDKSMDVQIKVLQRRIKELTEANIKLKTENGKLKRALKKKDMSFLNDL